MMITRIIQKVGFSKSRALCASVVYVPTGQRARLCHFQLGVKTCQKACQFFKHSYEMLKEISILYYYIKSSTLYLLS